MKETLLSVPFLLLVLTAISKYKVTSTNICSLNVNVLNNATFGNFSSPNYPNKYPFDVIKIWKIVAPVGHVIDLYFITFALETTRLCQSDYVKIRNRCNDTVPLAVYCDHIPRPLRSTTNVLWVEFRSDESTNNDGFEAVYILNSVSTKPLSCPRPSDNLANIDYCTNLGQGNKFELSKMEVQCCNKKDKSCSVNKELAARNGGSITSPGYPGNYPSGTKYLWRITAPEGYVVQINFTQLTTHQTSACSDLETKCKCDYIQVLDGPCQYDVGPQWCGAWTSQYKYPSFLTTGRHMVVIFKSDWHISVGGFFAHYRKARYCKGDQPISCITNGNPSCCRRDANVCVSGKTTRSHCPRDGDPANYTGCCIVNGSPACCPVNNSFNCPRPSDNQALIDVCYNGSQPICCNKNVPACRYNELLTDPSGTISSPNYPLKYPDNKFFVWRITVPWGYVVQLNFTKLQLQFPRCPRCSCDYVGVRDGPCSNVIETKWCETDSGRLPSFVSTGRHLQVFFNSDALHNNYGFVAKYKRVLTVKCGGDTPVLCTVNGLPQCCKEKSQESSSTRHCLNKVTLVIMITAELLMQYLILK